MKRLILLASFVFVIAGMASGNLPLLSGNTSLSGDKSTILIDQDQKKEAALKTVYTCSMHPSVIQDKPGKCPKCGMNLTAKEVRKDVYTCSMHPEVVQDKPGKCPKCGMNLTKKEPVKQTESPKN